jgi:hypothetical protein
MVFEDIVAVLERAFKLELSVVHDTTVFEVASEDGGTKVQVLVQNVDERKLVLLSADIGELPPEGCEILFRTMLEADDEIMDAINELKSGGIEPERKDRTMSKEDLLNGIGIVFDALKKARGPDERKALREANMENLVKALLQALNKVRKLDNRNTQLVSNVREVFYGNPEIKPDDVLKEISDVLNEKSADPFKKVEENILNHVEDNLDGNFNINAFLNGN